jgi:hypothetical protein
MLIWTGQLVVLSLFVPRIWNAYKLIDAGREAGTSLFLQGAFGICLFFIMPMYLANLLNCDIVGRWYLIALYFLGVGGTTFGLLFGMR